MISFSKIGNKSHYWLRFSEIKQSKRLRLYLYPRGFHWILSHSMQKNMRLREKHVKRLHFRNKIIQRSQTSAKSAVTLTLTPALTITIKI